MSKGEDKPTGKLEPGVIYQDMIKDDKEHLKYNIPNFHTVFTLSF